MLGRGYTIVDTPIGKVLFDVMLPVAGLCPPN